MFYLCFIHFSLGRRSLVILWNMQNKIRMKSSLSIKIGSCCIGVRAFYPLLSGEEISSHLVDCAKKIKMKSAIWKNWIILYQLFYPLLPQRGYLFSSCGVEYAENENEKSLLIKIVSAFYPLLSGEEISSHLAWLEQVTQADIKYAKKNQNEKCPLGNENCLCITMMERLGKEKTLQTDWKITRADLALSLKIKWLLLMIFNWAVGGESFQMKSYFLVV